MSEHRLERTQRFARGTFGRLTSAAGVSWYSMEREWNDNLPRVSCIKPGRYRLRKWSSEKNPKTYCLAGGDVGVVPGPGIHRSAILIHPANRPLELQGCLALGLAQTERGILRSAPAVEAFLAELDASDGPHWLTIAERFDTHS